MKKRFLHIALILIVCFFFQIFLMELTVKLYPRFNEQLEARSFNDQYDPSLARLDNVKKFTAFCDSLYGSNEISDSAKYANIVNTATRFRFQHGYTWYHFGHNYIAKILAPLVDKTLSAIVVPDDMLKYPLAACSQQSIISLKVLMDKGFKVRKVGFFEPTIGGHFCYEVFYNGGWHFYDPDREPDEKVLLDNHRPGIQYLVANPTILRAAYPRDDSSFVMSLYKSYKISNIKKLPGWKARLFQQTTKFLSYTSWIFLGLLYFYIEKKFFMPKKKK